MKFALPLTLAVAASLAACSERSSAPSEVKLVAVLDHSHKQLVVIDQAAQLKEFTVQWAGKRNTGKSTKGMSPNDFQYYLDVQAETGGGRWTYSSAGLATKLDPLAQPVYQVPDPEEFNRLLSITK